MTLFRSFIISLLTLLPTGFAGAIAAPNLDPNDPSWELQKDEDGIAVYFKSVDGSDIKAFMGKTIMKASLSSIIKVMKDERRCIDWVQGCVETESLGEKTFNEAYQYGINDLPWPADDRDYVTKVSTTDNPDTGEIRITMDAVEGHVPLSDNVRLTTMNIEYIFSPISQTETEVIWLQHTEPGGNIPDWLVNMLLIDIPYYSLNRLEGVANRPEYRSAEFSYGKDKHIKHVD